MDLAVIAAEMGAILSGAKAEARDKLLDGLETLPGRRGGAEAARLRLEVSVLRQAPADEAEATAMAHAFVNRANDLGFRPELESWWVRAREGVVGKTTREGVVGNTISGGTFYGPVVQGRDFRNTDIGSNRGPGEQVRGRPPGPDFDDDDDS